MAQATIDSFLMEHAESSTAATILRNEDPLSHALRAGMSLNMGDIASLSRAVSPIRNGLSSTGTSSTAVFTSHDDSSVTKPTSAGTGTAPPDKGYNARGKEKVRVSYASSLSGTHGSASEAEAERKTLRRDDLLSMGEWATKELASTQPLKGAARAKERSPSHRLPKYKKPKVVITQEERQNPLSEDAGTTFTPTILCDGAGKQYLRHRTPKHDEDPLRLAEEGQVEPDLKENAKFKPLSRTRIYALVGLIVLMLMTVAFATYGAHLTGKVRMSCTKGIVFAATTLLVCFTVLAMITARRLLSEALLAGLLEFVFGFALLVELDDFM